MNWYIAKVVFNIAIGEGNHTPQFDEQYRLIKEQTIQAAFEKAERLGHGEEEMMLNDKNEMIKWEFVGVSELYPIDELSDGMELCSSIREERDRALYIETVQMKTAYVRSKLEPESERV
ncbi:MAG: DUF4288 domain-containing protein [Cyclobacteriaceae bacterium]